MVSVEHRIMEFGDSLRRRRIDGGFGEGKAFAEHIGWQASKVSRIENARTLPSSDDVKAWLRALGVPEAEAAKVLAELRDLRLERDRWKHQLSRGHAERQEREVVSELAATSIISVEFFVVNGLAQTRDYAAAVFERAAELHQSPSDTNAAVLARLRRQEVLYDSSKDIEILLGESALRYPIVPPAIARAQLDRLLGLVDLDHVRFGVIPLDIQLPTITMHGYTILDDTVVVEVNHTEIVTQEPEDVALHRHITDRLREVAVRGPDARILLRQCLQRLTT